MKSLLRIPEELLSRAISLEPLGLQESAWTKADALAVLESLGDSTVVVLGGDVYSATLGRLQPASENWSCERQVGEELAAFARRSQKVAIAFLQTFPDSPGDYFALVLTEGQAAGL